MLHRSVKNLTFMPHRKVDAAIHAAYDSKTIRF
jgi:hypothetical protein